MIHWLELPEGPIHSHTHTCTNICMSANTHAWHSPLSQPSPPACGKNTARKHTHTRTHTQASKPDGNKPRQTQQSSLIGEINSGYLAQCFIGIIPPLRSPLLKYPQCIGMMNERPDDRLKINLASIRQKRVYPVTQMST